MLAFSQYDTLYITNTVKPAIKPDHLSTKAYICR